MNDTAIVNKVYSLEQQQNLLEQKLSDHRREILHLKASITKKTKSNLPVETLQPVILPSQAHADKPSSEAKFLPLPSDDQASSFINNAANPVSEKAEKPKITPITREKTVRDYHKMEQDFAKVWFVRLGIISLLTGLVFLSNHAYQNYITDWSAGPRLAGLYLLASLLLIVGTYFEKAKVALSNYGKVIAAGGIATLYYTSYASHHVDRLQVIESPLAGGILLTMSAAGCLVYALWKKSNITAICSIALAYYSTSINPVGSFSIISGLLLTLTGLTLLHKLRSASIGFVTMIGAYLTFIYWQGFIQPHAASYTSTAWCITCYWILSAVSTWIPRRSGLKPFNKTQVLAFTSINNAFLVLLLSIQFPDFHFVEPLWPVSAIIGSSFLVIGGFLKFGKNLTSSFSLIPFRESLASLYLMKGTALITLSLCLKLTGPSLALTLTMQSIIVLIAAHKSGQPEKTRFTIASGIILILGFLTYIGSMADQNITTIEITTIHHIVQACLYLGYALVWHFGTLNMKEKTPLLSIIPAAFSLCSIVFAITTADISTFAKILLFLTSNLALTCYESLPNKKTNLPYFCMGSHLFSLVAALLFIEHIHRFNMSHLFIITMLTYALTAINLHAYIRKGTPHKLYTIYLTAATALFITTVSSTHNGHIILLVMTLTPIAYHAIYQRLLQYKLTFIVALGFLIYPLCWLVYLASYIPYAVSTHPLVQLIVAIIPIAHLAIMQKRLLSGFIQARPVFYIATAIMIAIWQFCHIPTWELSFTLTAAVYHLLDRQQNKLFTGIGIIYYVTSVLSMIDNLRFTTDALSIYLIALVPLACYTVKYYIIRNHTKFDKTDIQKYTYFRGTQKILAIISSLAIWIVCSQHIIHLHDRAALSIAWAIIGLAVLAIGFISKDIVFRTMAFLILGCTVLHVYGVDVWKINALLRIISFITLGIVMLVIGYLYCRKADNDEHSDQ